MTAPRPTRPADFLPPDPCPKCSYPLTELPAEHACPECGFAWDDSSLVLVGRTPSVSTAQWAGLALIAYSVAVAVVSGAGSLAGPLAGAGLAIAGAALVIREVVRRRQRDIQSTRLVIDRHGVSRLTLGGEELTVPWTKVRMITAALHHRYVLSVARATAPHCVITAIRTDGSRIRRTIEFECDITDQPQDDGTPRPAIGLRPIADRRLNAIRTHISQLAAPHRSA
ncbi:MAG: hypothetical protein AB8G96_17225 [Phycisphaerales bacterium]